MKSSAIVGIFLFEFKGMMQMFNKTGGLHPRYREGATVAAGNAALIV
jgi:hypothetical protein